MMPQQKYIRVIKQKINAGYDLESRLDITSRIEQSCTESTAIFKLITYNIMKKIE